MPGAMKTTGDLRTFLIETMEGLRKGTVDHASADRIAKLAGQVTASLTAEAQVAVASQKSSFGVGSLPLGGVTEAKAEPPAPEVRPARIAPTPAVNRSRDRVFCDQCDRNVTVNEAIACKSAFCKAKVAA